MRANPARRISGALAARRVVWHMVCGLAAMTGAGSTAHAQSVGTFRWQLQPFCNIVTMHVTHVEGVFRLEGSDDQCGAATVAPATGAAALNPDGSIALGLTHVTTPGGAPVHVDAVVTLPGASGTWRDSAGNSGSFVFTPGVGIGGSPRPAGGIAHTHEQGAPTSVAVGPQALQNATVPGLTAVGASALAANTTGCCNAAVGFSALSVNQTGNENTAFGYQALRYSTSSFNTAVGASAAALTTGFSNTAVGAQALIANTSSNNNAAFGDSSLRSINADDHDNAAFGHHALGSLTQGAQNVAVGSIAGEDLTAGSFNTMVGFWAGGNFTSGDNNIFIGRAAGAALSTGSRNIHIGSASAADESDSIRIGVSQTSTYVAGIAGQTSASGVAVYVNAQGKLGTITSSRRYKDNIRTLSDAQRIVQTLQPVRFTYKPAFDDGSRQEQYGLIAEDVALVDRNLVVETDGQIQTVRYHFLPPLLVAEVQRLEAERAALDRQVRAHGEETAALRQQIAELRALLTALAERLR